MYYKNYFYFCSVENSFGMDQHKLFCTNHIVNRSHSVKNDKDKNGLSINDKQARQYCLVKYVRN